MDIHRTRPLQERLETLASNGHRNAHTHGPPHGVPASHPIFKPKGLGIFDAKGPSGLQIGRNRNQLSAQVCMATFKPCLGQGGIGHGLLRCEGFAHDHKHGRRGV